MIPTAPVLDRVMAALAERRIVTAQQLPAQPVAVSVPDAAAMLGVSESYFRRRLLATGRIGSWHEGSRHLVAVAALVAYAEEQTRAQATVALPTPIRRRPAGRTAA